MVFLLGIEVTSEVGSLLIAYRVREITCDVLNLTKHTVHTLYSIIAVLHVLLDTLFLLAFAFLLGPADNEFWIVITAVSLVASVLLVIAVIREFRPLIVGWLVVLLFQIVL